MSQCWLVRYKENLGGRTPRKRHIVSERCPLSATGCDALELWHEESEDTGTGDTRMAQWYNRESLPIGTVKLLN